MKKRMICMLLCMIMLASAVFPAAALEPTLTAEVLYSDVDGDEEVTASDAVEILRYTVGISDNDMIGTPA